MSKLRVLNALGDTTIEWDVKDASSVEKVRAEFDRIIQGGYMAFRIDTPSSGEAIRTFEPEAHEIIMTAPMVGG